MTEALCTSQHEFDMRIPNIDKFDNAKVFGLPELQLLECRVTKVPGI